MRNSTKILLFVVAVASLMSCRQEGCSDPDAVNYDARAKDDDGSCMYQGSVVFWYRQEVADQLEQNGVTLLAATFFTQQVGTHVPDNPFSEAPDCDAAGSFTINYDMGSNKNVLVDYMIEEVNGFGFWTDILTLQANTCKKIELY
ncbi:MAG: hypothetical protein RL226_109 [Bacteroidota bacterium]